MTASLLLPPSPLPRALVLCGDREGLERLSRVGEQFGGLALGVLLRDPLHRREETLALLAHYHNLNFSKRWTPITNTWPGGGGVHLTSVQLRMSDAEINAVVGGRWFGASAHNVEELDRAAAVGASYLLLSPIYPTGSKPGHPGVGIERLRELCARSSVPAFALGGVTAGRVRECLGAGAHGVATLSGVDEEWLAAVERQSLRA